MRKPIALDQWHPSAARRDVFTTVMNWTSYGDVTWNGRSYGQKDKEFLRFVDLPLSAWRRSCWSWRSALESLDARRAIC